MNDSTRESHNSCTQILDFIEDKWYLCSNNLGISISTSTMGTPWLDDNDKPLNVFIVVGAPHDNTRKGDDVVIAQYHLKALKRVLQQTNNKLLDVLSKLFVLSLEDEHI